MVDPKPISLSTVSEGDYDGAEPPQPFVAVGLDIATGADLASLAGRVLALEQAASEA